MCMYNSIYTFIHSPLHIYHLYVGHCCFPEGKTTTEDPFSQPQRGQFSPLALLQTWPGDRACFPAPAEAKPGRVGAPSQETQRDR